VCLAPCAVAIDWVVRWVFGHVSNALFLDTSGPLHQQCLVSVRALPHLQKIFELIEDVEVRFREDSFVDELHRHVLHLIPSVRPHPLDDRRLWCNIFELQERRGTSSGNLSLVIGRQRAWHDGPRLGDKVHACDVTPRSQVPLIDPGVAEETELIFPTAGVLTYFKIVRDNVLEQQRCGQDERVGGQRATVCLCRFVLGLP